LEWRFSMSVTVFQVWAFNPTDFAMATFFSLLWTLAREADT
jgi:hypothetical protein